MHGATDRPVISTELALDCGTDADKVAANGHREDVIADFCR
jgi:hypothetical protein